MSKKEDLSNIAYTKEYLDAREVAIAAVIRSENIADTTNEPPDDGYIQNTIHYETEINGIRHLGGSNKIYDSDNALIHEYICLNTNSLCALIAHSNGRKYFVYKEDLYGYSVLDIMSNDTFRYIPAESFRGGETFIITGISYNPTKNIMAATGCYWAYP